MSEQQENQQQTEREPATFLTMRFADGKNGTTGKEFKRITNVFFNGGFDKTSNPVFSNKEEGIVAFVAKSNASLSIFKAGEDGKVPENDKPILSVKLDRFVAEGTSSKGLEVGQGAVTGPRADEIVAKFKEVLANKEANKEIGDGDAPAAAPRPRG